MPDDPLADLTTAQLAERTGVPAGTLRMWETRHAFPEPKRLPSGHRRYGERDVLAVREVLLRREQGLSLSAAIARAGATGRGPSSIFAGLRQRRPELQPALLSKPALVELSRAIEDEYCARAGTGLLIGSFQRVRFYRQVERRWRELSRTARLAVVLADFKRLRKPAGAPVEVPIPRAHPLTREWTLVIDAPEAYACLAAWEPPGTSELPERRRRFEVLFSPEPEVARAATAIATELVGELAPTVAGEIASLAPESVAPSSVELRQATALTHRMVGYLATELDAPDY